MQLAAHPDRSKVKFVTDGLRTGFRTGFHADKINLKSAETNCSSAIAHPNVIDKYLADEIDARRVAGPFEAPPFPNLHVSRFGVIPKKSKPDAWRLILDLSFPTDHSVNDGIFKKEFPVVYSTVRDAINLIVQNGKGAFMSKVDIRKAYRIVPIHPDDRYLLGMKWQEKFFVDLALPFGLRSAPGIFDSLADLFEWTLRHNYHVPNILHYLDDFFTLGPADSMVCSNSLNAIQQASLDIGISLAPEKCEGPTTCITFLGIELNSIYMTARLPNDKLAELQTLIGSWTGKKFCTRKELESLVGKLNHACAVVAPGRTFLQRLINLLRGSKPRHKFIRLTKQARLDLQWWQDLLPTWNGVSFFDLPELAPVPDFELSTDASGNKGFGGCYNNEWFSVAWLPSQLKLGMAYKELYTIVIACHLWGHCWRHKRVLFYCDNESVVQIVNSGASREDIIMDLVRELFLVAAKNDFRIYASHVAGKKNLIADSLSRFNLQEFFRLVPGACPLPKIIPVELQARLTSNI